MGNQVSNGSSTATGKVILLDGSIQEFDKTLTVAELMLEYPQQVVVELKQAQSKPTPLPADKVLEFDKFYLMVPLRKGKPAHLSPQQAQQILLRANAILRSKMMMSSSNLLPLFAKICPATTQDDAQHKLAASKREILASEEPEMVKESNEVDQQGLDGFERPDYLSRQLSGRGWKPKLDTIEEKKDEIKKVSNWVVLAKAVKRIENKGLVWG